MSVSSLPVLLGGGYTLAREPSEQSLFGRSGADPMSGAPASGAAAAAAAAAGGTPSKTPSPLERMSSRVSEVSRAALQEHFNTRPSAHKVTKLLRLLCDRIVFARRRLSVAPRGEGEEARNRKLDALVQYSLRVLASRIAADVTERDPVALVESIKQSIAREGLDGDDRSAFARALRVDEAAAKLLRHEILKEKWAVLHTLHMLRDEGRHQHSGIPNLPIDRPLSALGLGQLPALSRPAPAAAAPARAAETAAEQRARELRREQHDAAVTAALSYDVPEEALVRDAVFAFQGIDGRFIKFDERLDGYAVVAEVGVPLPVRNIVRRICELGWLYRRVCIFVKETLETAGVGLVGQSFCGAVQKELTDYYRLIAVLETHLGEAAVATTRAEQLTLKRLYVWAQDPLERMRLMAMLCDAARGRKGGALASALGAYLRHGDATAHAFVKRIMAQVCQPIFGFVKGWVLQGEVEDPYGEFFVADDPRVERNRLWRDRYRLRKSMLPTFIDAELATKIMVIGKSINFLRHCCEVKEWRVEAKFALGDDVDYDGENNAELEAAVSEAGRATQALLMRVMLERYKLKQHAWALKKYLLLGQGDFIQHLLDLVNRELDAPAQALQGHQLMNHVEAAIRVSNAQYEDQDIINRLSVRMLAPSEGDRGWDVFSLDYKTSSPIDVMLGADAIASYLRVFGFLWQLKRVEHRLASAFLRQVTREHRREEAPALAGTLALGFHLRSEMLHFVRNLHNFIMFEVLEAAWTRFAEVLDAARDLDQVLDAHERYLREIVDKALMGAGAVSSPQMSSSDGSAPVVAAAAAAAASAAPLLQLLHQLFDMILKFCALQERIYDALAQEQERASAVAKGAEANTKKGQWGIAGRKEAEHESARQRVPQEIATNFAPQLAAVKRQYDTLLAAFFDAADADPRPDLRSLRLRLNFNEYYSQPLHAPAASAAPAPSARRAPRGTAPK